MIYALDFRKKVFETQVKEGLTHRETAVRCGIGIATVTRWRGILAPKMASLRPARKINLEQLRQDVQDYPDAYRYERAKRFGVGQATGCTIVLSNMK